MRKKVFLSGVLAVAMAVTLLQPCSVPAEAEDGNAAVTAGPESSLTGDEVELAKSAGNPITTAFTEDGKPIYGGDPAVLVDGDTVYLYTGHDEAVTEAYKITEWI